MKSYRFAALLLMAGGLGYFTACATTKTTTSKPTATQTSPESDPEVRLATLRVRGGQASLTLFPVVLAGHPSTDAADALGLLLEKAGMQQLETTEVAFTPAADAGFDQLPASFGEFVRGQDLATDYALCMQVTGSPETGVDEVWAVLVDRTGASVWTDRQGPEDQDYKRMRPRNPMTCCALVKKRLVKVLDLPAPHGGARQGKMAELWARKSGLPDEAELNAIEQRREIMSQAGKGRTLMVYPVKVNNETERAAAEELVDALTQDRLAVAQVAEAEPSFELEPTSNEQRRLWDLARAFRDYVRANPPQTDYALYADYLIRTDREQVHTVHFIVCDRAGEWVIVDFQNEYQPDFKSVEPKSRADCAELVARRLKHVL